MDTTNVTRVKAAARDAALSLLNRITVSVSILALAGVGVFGAVSAATNPGTSSSTTQTSSSSTTYSSSSSSANSSSSSSSSSLQPSSGVSSTTSTGSYVSYTSLCAHTSPLFRYPT